MTEKRYKIHNMIKGMNVGELVDLELMRELTAEYGAYENVDVEIMDNGKSMTYKEVVDLLNENEQLKQEGANVERLIDDLGSEELKRQYEEIINDEVSNSITNDKTELSVIGLRLIEASVLEEVLEELEKNNASSILIRKVKLALKSMAIVI